MKRMISVMLVGGFIATTVAIFASQENSNEAVRAKVEEKGSCNYKAKKEEKDCWFSKGSCGSEKKSEKSGADIR